MTSTKIRLVVIAAACLALAGVLAPVSEPTTTTTTTTYGTNSTEEGHQGADVLIANSGYMVAVG
ncbi:MAG TPA: hypothetical protein VGD77_01900 [Gemmatimonadaceae bacterium]